MKRAYFVPSLIALSAGLVVPMSPALAAGAQFETQPATNITANSATLNGTFLSTGPQLGSQKFNWGTTPSYGNSGAGQPGAGVPNGQAYFYNLTGLTSCSVYNYQFSGTVVQEQPPPLQGGNLTFTTAGCSGFSGNFAPANWQKGSNAPVNLVNVSGAPGSMVLSSYPSWAISGVTFRYLKAPMSGTVTVTASLRGGGCTATYEINYKTVSLTSKSLSFAVQAGQEFGFALNPCHSQGTGETLTLSGFSLTP